jgi:hypothetical protein
MKRMFFAALFSSAALATTSAAEDFPLSKDYSGSYLCKASASSGLRFDEQSGNWIPTPFNVDKVQYIVKVTDTGHTERLESIRQTDRLYNVTVKDFDGNGKTRDCYNIRESGLGTRELIYISFGRAGCVYYGTDYIFDFENLKMQTMFRGGYMDPEKNTDTPYIELGKCQRID